ncbi:MAG TPA: tyrosine--tRNA ligase [Candidatus Levybacteria bacterium]|nr:tyrosine--tRNA ligase [Candidatus Levybacteria bacterium]
MNQIDELLTRGVANIISNKKALEQRLQSDKKLNIYLGIDPTSTHIHLGHAVPLRKLQQFAQMGHHVTFLIGDFTALIGDTSDKETERPILTTDEIQQNFETYKKQAEKILDFSKVTVQHNSEWLSKLTFAEIVKLTQHFSFGDFASRELIKKRLTEGKKVGLHEALYPVMQGYDSYFMDTDLQLGGTDQTFNMQAGRTLQKVLRDKESFVMTNEFLTGTDGRKMSKTWGNAIWLEESPIDMFGKVMSIKDDLIIEYYTLGTNVPLNEIETIKQRLESGENPLDIKKELATTIVSELHSKEEAQYAQNHFLTVVQQKGTPEKIDTITLTSGEQRTILDFIVENKLVSSKAEGKRLIEQKGVTFDKQPVQSPHEIIREGVLQIGKRTFIKIEISN